MSRGQQCTAPRCAEARCIVFVDAGNALRFALRPPPVLLKASETRVLAASRLAAILSCCGARFWWRCCRWAWTSARLCNPLSSQPGSAHGVPSSCHPMGLPQDLIAGLLEALILRARASSLDPRLEPRCLPCWVWHLVWDTAAHGARHTACRSTPSSVAKTAAVSSACFLPRAVLQLVRLVRCVLSTRPADLDAPTATTREPALRG